MATIIMVAIRHYGVSMQYDFLITDPSLWDHSEFSYRIVYSISATGSVGTQRRGEWLWVESHGDNLLYQKICDYVAQLMSPDEARVVKNFDKAYVYCNEWIDQSTLVLSCPEDRHFIKPAYVEHFGVDE